MRVKMGWVVLAFSVLLHSITLLSSWRFKDVFQDDSVMYLTLAQNLRKHGVLSQSFYEPLVPDAQRLPGYPVLLLLCAESPLVVLLFQHILVFASGIFLYKAAKLYLPPRTARYAAWLFVLSPLPLVFSNLLLSEILGIWGICLATWLWAKHQITSRVRFGVATILVISVFFYVKPIMLAYIPSFAVSIAGLMIYRKKFAAAIAVLLLPVFVLLPWALRYYAITGRVGLTTLLETNAYYGRIGGFSAWLAGENHRDDSVTFLAADSTANTEFPSQNVKSHHHECQTQETELINIPIGKIFVKLAFQNPLAFGVWLMEVSWQQASGLGYEAAFQATHSKLMSGVLSFLQVIVSGIWFLAAVNYVRTFRNQPLLCHFVVGTIFLHGVATAVGWADGRFRIPIEPLLCVLSVFNLPFNRGGHTLRQH